MRQINFIQPLKNKSNCVKMRIIFIQVVTDMIRIAIIDDDNTLCNVVEQYILSSCSDLQLKQCIDVYYTGESFCHALDNGECYHLLFLDIELAEVNGIKVGNFIREKLKNNRMQIVFISAKRDYAMKLFEFRPMNFLVNQKELQKK